MGGMNAYEVGREYARIGQQSDRGGAVLGDAFIQFSPLFADMHVKRQIVSVGIFRQLAYLR